MRGIILSLLVSLFVPSLAAAQPLDPQHYHPAATLQGLSTVKGANSDKPFDSTLMLVSIYSREPLTVVDTSFNEQRPLVRDRIDLMVSYAMGLPTGILGRLGLVHGIDLAAVVPFVPWQKETADIRGGRLVEVDRATGGMADPRLEPRITLPLSKRLPLQLAFLPVISFPAAVGGGFLGSKSVVFTPEVAGTVEVGPVLLAANLGFKVRAHKRVDGVNVRDQWLWRAGVGLDVGGVGGPKDLLVSLEAFGLSDRKPFQSTRESPTEFVATGRYRIGDFLVNAGVGTGLNMGYGAPRARLIIGGGWAPRSFDRDGDGIEDEIDGCPNQPEDVDSFQDEDGCPDLDNDGDGVADADDECIAVPEDLDEFEDENGCPDPDNDADGIMDPDDACPNEPEDVDTFLDTDGCPDPDNDKDGILDAADECPLVPEDFNDQNDEDGCPDAAEDRDADGIMDANDKCPDDKEDPDSFEDEDGCPDPDNDGDGILDAADKCPIEAEDLDEFMDEDGCPEEDNDGDGIWDVKDQCPNEAETINGMNDDDGCPDVVERVRLTAEKIEIAEKVYFDSNSDVIQSRSFDLLDEIASILKKNETVFIRVEGHTDDRGPADYNLDLSERRAASVRKYLTDKGVAPERLESIGYGESKPIAPNSTSRGRDTNRRVEFTVTKGP